MTPNRIDHARDLVIIGIATRTSPARAATDIPAHWQAFMARGVPAGEMYAVYCDYESDATGAYTLVLGTVADAAAPVPAGMRRVRIPAGAYAAFAADGDPTRVVAQTWMRINTEWAERGQRRYIADYERYTDREHCEIAVGIDA